MINFAFLKLKDSDSQAPLLLCVYLGSHDKELNHIAKNVAFLNASGCCNGLALDKFAETYTIERKRRIIAEVDTARKLFPKVNPPSHR